MTDTPEAVAWLYAREDGSTELAKLKWPEQWRQREGWVSETPLYPAPISLYESQVRWRKAFDVMHRRAMAAEAELTDRSVDGYVLVPVEPTMAMLDAGWLAISIYHPAQADMGRGTEAEAYKAMIAAYRGQ